jgi:hypothetical protein
LIAHLATLLPSSQEQGAHDRKGRDAIPAGHEPWVCRVMGGVFFVKLPRS